MKNHNSGYTSRKAFTKHSNCLFTSEFIVGTQCKQILHLYTQQLLLPNWTIGPCFRSGSMLNTNTCMFVDSFHSTLKIVYWIYHHWQLLLTHYKEPQFRPHIQKSFALKHLNLLFTSESIVGTQRKQNLHLQSQQLLFPNLTMGPMFSIRLKAEHHYMYTCEGLPQYAKDSE